jgi:hypothetical protein
LTVFHLASSWLAKERRKIYYEKVIEPVTDERLGSQVQVQKEEQEKEKELEKRTFDILDLFLEHLPEEEMSVVSDTKVGSVLHYLAAINYARGVEMLTEYPYLHPPDILNSAQLSPLMVGLNNKCWDAVQVLLDRDVNVERLDPVKMMTPLQLLLRYAGKIEEERLDLVDKFLQKGRCCGGWRCIAILLIMAPVEGNPCNVWRNPPVF